MAENKTLDQADVLAANERLESENSAFKTQIATLTQKLADADAASAKLKVELDTTKGLLATAQAEVARLTPLAADASKQAAAMVAAAGITKTASVPAPVAAAKPLTATEKALAAIAAADALKNNNQKSN